jgi:hypothetical protein
MPTTLNPTCPLCGLRYTDRPLLDLHIREDHRRRDDRPEPDPGASGATRTSPPRARGPFPLHSLPTELFPAARDATALPLSARYWVTKSTTSEICGAEPVVSSQSIISGTWLPTTP